MNSIQIHDVKSIHAKCSEHRRDNGSKFYTFEVKIKGENNQITLIDLYSNDMESLKINKQW
jgi:hypothetical protein